MDLETHFVLLYKKAARVTKKKTDNETNPVTNKNRKN